MNKFSAAALSAAPLALAFAGPAQAEDKTYLDSKDLATFDLAEYAAKPENLSSATSQVSAPDEVKGESIITVEGRRENPVETASKDGIEFNPPLGSGDLRICLSKRIVRAGDFTAKAQACALPGAAMGGGKVVWAEEKGGLLGQDFITSASAEYLYGKSLVGSFKPDLQYMAVELEIGKLGFDVKPLGLRFAPSVGYGCMMANYDLSEYNVPDYKIKECMPLIGFHTASL